MFLWPPVAHSIDKGFSSYHEYSASIELAQKYMKTYDLYFTGRDDPRDGCIMIGEDTKPNYFEFETQMPTYANHARTVILNRREPVAWFDWQMGGNQLGMVTIGQRQFSMAELVLAGIAPNIRWFQFTDGKGYEWRRCIDDPGSYELYCGPTVRIALFRRYAQPTPVGPSYGYLKYVFDNDDLLLEALLALNLNRWLDWGTT